jgi:hypothetical protein
MKSLVSPFHAGKAHNKRQMRIQLIADAYARAKARHTANKEIDLKLVQMELDLKEKAS